VPTDLIDQGKWDELGALIHEAIEQLK